MRVCYHTDIGCSTLMGVGIIRGTPKIGGLAPWDDGMPDPLQMNFSPTWVTMPNLITVDRTVQAYVP